jgi:hypothetical protein
MFTPSVSRRGILSPEARDRRYRKKRYEAPTVSPTLCFQTLFACVSSSTRVLSLALT